MSNHYTIKAARQLAQKGHPWRIYLTLYNPLKNQDKFYEIKGVGTHMVTVRHGRSGSTGRTLPQDNSKRLNWGLDQARSKINKGYNYGSGVLKSSDQTVKDILNPPKTLQLTGPYALIRGLRREKEAPIWEALDEHGELLMHLPNDSAKEILNTLPGWGGGFDPQGREIITFNV